MVFNGVFLWVVRVDLAKIYFGLGLVSENIYYISC